MDQVDKDTRLSETAPDPFLGRTVDGYRIDDVVGRGGMGVVYRATQLSLNRPVAIKVLPPDVAEHPQFLERFHREVDVLSKLAHPNIVTVFERGEVDGRQYLVMEYVRGTSLRDVIRKGPLQRAEALALVRSVLAALEHAHDAGIVHRDIKPENVLVAPGGIVKVADFGLSRLLGPAAVTRLTHTHLLLGTFEYMAPEQREKAKEADERSDLYATGVVFYELLTGELPIGKFEMPSSKRPECDSRIDGIVERSLEKDPGKRWQRASEMGGEVSRLRSSAPLEPEPAPPRPAVRPPDPLPSAPRRAGLRFWHVIVGILMLWGVGVMADASSSTGLDWKTLVLGGAAVALVMWWLVTRPATSGRRAGMQAARAGVGAAQVLFWILTTFGVFILMAVMVFFSMGVRAPEEDDARNQAEAARIEAYDRAARKVIESERHGVMAHWVRDKQPGLVEEWSTAPETVRWLAGLLEVDVAEARRFRLACWSNQILIVLPRETGADWRKVQFAYGYALARLAPGVQPAELKEPVDEEFRRRVEKVPLPPLPEVG